MNAANCTKTGQPSHRPSGQKGDEIMNLAKSESAAQSPAVTPAGPQILQTLTHCEYCGTNGDHYCPSDLCRPDDEEIAEMERDAA